MDKILTGEAEEEDIPGDGDTEQMPGAPHRQGMKKEELKV